MYFAGELFSLLLIKDFFSLSKDDFRSNIIFSKPMNGASKRGVAIVANIVEIQIFPRKKYI